MALVRWEPLRELNSLQHEMNRLFGGFFDQPAGQPGGLAPERQWIPAMDLVETDGAYILRADLPGLSTRRREDRARGQRADDLRRARRPARAADRRLLPDRARVGLLRPLADAAAGHRCRPHRGQFHRRRARGAHSPARAAQAPPRLDHTATATPRRSRAPRPPRSRPPGGRRAPITAAAAQPPDAAPAADDARPRRPGGASARAGASPSVPPRAGGAQQALAPRPRVCASVARHALAGRS